MQSSPARPLTFAVFVFLALACCAVGQCPLQWQPGDPIPTVHGDVHATTVWDPDGAGPAPTELVVGGRFAVGNQLSTTIASFDGAAWGSLGTPPMPDITALTTWNGLLVAAGGVGSQYAVAMWDGATWSVLGTTDGRINTMVVFNGNLIVGGFFSIINGMVARNIAQWSGTSWSEPGGGLIGEVHTMVVFSSLYVGGDLSHAGAVPLHNLAIWNGSAWTAGANFNDTVYSLAIRAGITAASSFLFAGGQFSTVDGVSANHIARFTVSTNAWTAIPGLPGSRTLVVHVRSTSATSFQLNVAIEDFNAIKVWRLNGTTWSPLGDVLDVTPLVPTSLAVFNGQLVASFEGDQVSNGPPTQAVRIHDGTDWQPAAGPGFDDEVLAVTPLDNDLVVGGAFTTDGSTNLAHIARGGPGAWQPLGSGIGGSGIGGTAVRALCTLPNGDLVAGGDFATAGGMPAANIARWDGSNWSALGSGVNGAVHAMLVLPDGDLVVAGAFTLAGGIVTNHIARWNGTTWSPLGTGLTGGVEALARLDNGDLVAAGLFTMAGGVPANHVARWDGSNWSALGAGVDGFALAVVGLPGGDIVVGGNFTNAGGIFSPGVARWNGITWSAQSTPTAAWDYGVHTLVALPDGDYIAGGPTSFFGLGGIFGGTDSNLARHRGGASSLTWEAFDLEAVDLLGNLVSTSARLSNGDQVVGGRFDGAGGSASHNVAVLRPTCPATAVSYGSGCTGSGGANEVHATELPWVGGSFRAQATGMPTSSIALAVTGFTPLAVPLPALLPQGVVGCTALVSPDLIDAVLPTAGTVTTGLNLPATLSLAGLVFYHQVVPLEFDAAGNLIAVTGTNGLTLTIGVL